MSDKVKTWLDQLRIAGKPDEAELKGLLAQNGIGVPRGFVLPPDQAMKIGLLAPPYAVKVCAPDIFHKTEAGGVRLNLGKAGLLEAVAELRSRFPDTPLLVEEQIAFSGPEFILGALRDPDFGPAVMVGAGGILTELYRDVSFRLAPLSEDEAGRMLSELRLYPVLTGFRGLCPDRQALAAIIARLGDLAAALGEQLGQLDINPLVWSSDRWLALDAKMALA